MGLIASKLSQINFCDIYCNGILTTAIMIGISNMYSSVIFKNDNDDNIMLFGTNLLKSLTYGCMWPVFWPHAILKTFIKEIDIVNIRGYKINRNGLLSHFMPVTYFLDNNNNEDDEDNTYFV